MTRFSLMIITACIWASTASANMIWVGLILASGRGHYYGILPTLVIETFIIAYITRHHLGKSFIISAIINGISFVAGLIYAFTFGIGTSLIISSFTKGHGTFSIYNWVGEILAYAAASSMIEFLALILLCRWKWFKAKVLLNPKNYLLFFAVNAITAALSAHLTKL